MTPQVTRRAFLAASTTAALLNGAIELPGSGSQTRAAQNGASAKEVPGISPDMPWQRRQEPALSSTTTRLDWCKTYCYSPHVFRTMDGYRMYYIGRTGDSVQIKSLMGFAVGMATSKDGLTWQPYGDAPVLTVDDVPWGAFAIQTPHVLWDEEETRYKLWFIGITEWVSNAEGGAAELTARLGYATSADGVRWDVHPVPVFESGRRPCVHKDGPGQYRMWMNSRSTREEPWNSLYQNVYEFRSGDGIRWTRSDEPVLRASDKHRAGCIYA